MFFALSHTLGYEAVFVKDRAKQRCGLEAFDDITTEQLSELIDRLLELRESGGQENGGLHADTSHMPVSLADRRSQRLVGEDRR